MKRILLFLSLAFAVALGFGSHSTNVNWVPALGSSPAVRSAPKVIVAGDKMVMLFGFLECFHIGVCDNFFYNDTWVADLGASTVAWESVTPTSSISTFPASRAFFGADYYANAGKIVFFGGVYYSADLTVFQVFSDMWYYDVHLNKYESISYPAGTGPGARIGMGLHVWGDAFYFFGGFDDTFTGHNDFWKFDLIHNTWTRLLADSPSPPGPIGRYLYNSALNEEFGRYYFFAGDTVDNGVNFSDTNDTWYYNFATNSYVEVFPVSDPTNDGRSHGASVFHRGFFFVIDGEENNMTVECPTISLTGPQAGANTMIYLNTNNPHAVWEYADLGTVPIPMKRIAGDVYQGVLYFTSGFGFTCPTDTISTSLPVWNPYLWSVDLNHVIDSL